MYVELNMKKKRKCRFGGPIRRLLQAKGANVLRRWETSDFRVEQGKNIKKRAKSCVCVFSQWMAVPEELSFLLADDDYIV